jgi:hypothetical protein
MGFNMSFDTFQVTWMMGEINLQSPQSCIDAECHQVQEQ